MFPGLIVPPAGEDRIRQALHLLGHLAGKVAAGEELHADHPEEDQVVDQRDGVAHKEEHVGHGDAQGGATPAQLEQLHRADGLSHKAVEPARSKGISSRTITKNRGYILGSTLGFCIFLTLLY